MIVALIQGRKVALAKLDVLVMAGERHNGVHAHGPIGTELGRRRAAVIRSVVARAQEVHVEGDARDLLRRGGAWTTRTRVPAEREVNALRHGKT